MHCKKNLLFKSNVVLHPIVSADFYLKENELILTLRSFCECFMVHLPLWFSLCAKCNQLYYNCWRLEQKEQVFKRQFKTGKRKIKITALSQTFWQTRPSQGGYGGATLFHPAIFQNSSSFLDHLCLDLSFLLQNLVSPHFSAI